MSFDRLAPHYDWLESFTAGHRLERARTFWLPALRDAKHVLSVGEGHGRFAAACARAYPGIGLDVVDASTGMLVRACRRLARLGPGVENVRLLHAAWPQWRPPENSYDAIVTCFFLDCFPPPELARIVADLAAAARPAATWLNVDFAMPERGFARWRARHVHRLMYAFFRAATRLRARQLTAPDELLRSHGFELAGRREWNRGLIRADCWRRTKPDSRPGEAQSLSFQG